MNVWWRADGVLDRFVTDLLGAEMAACRPSFSATALRWHDELPIDETGLGADSLDRLRLAAAVAESLNLNVNAEKGDGLIAADTLGAWLKICRRNLGRHDDDISFCTSGSTGLCRSTVHALAALEQEAAHLATLFSGCARVLYAVPAHHIYGFIFTILLPRHLGKVSLLDLRSHSPSALGGLARPGDLVIGYPDYWRGTVSGQEMPLGVVGVTSTAPCPFDTAMAVAARGIRLVEVFGATETSGLGWRDDPDASFRWFPYWRWDGGERIERTLPTGELVSVPLQDRLEATGEGHFRTHGRIDTVVQVGGVNVSLDAVREALRNHPYVADATIRLMRPDEGNRLKAFVVPVGGAPPHAYLHEALSKWTEERLPPPQRPRAFAFGPFLPTTLSGKPMDWDA